MTEETTEFSPLIFFAIVAAVFVNEYFSVLSLMS